MSKMLLKKKAKKKAKLLHNSFDLTTALYVTYYCSCWLLSDTQEYSAQQKWLHPCAATSNSNDSKLQQLHYFQAFKRDIWIYSKSKLTVSFDCIIQKNTNNRSLHSFNNWICSFLNIVHLQLYYDGRLDPSWRGGRLSWHFSVTIFAQPVLCCRGCVPLPFSMKYCKGVLLDSDQKEHFNRLHFSFYSFRQTLM